MQEITRHSLVHWFAPPEFARGDLRNRARALWIVSWPFFLVIAVLLGFAALAEPETLARRMTTIAAVGGLVTVLHMASRAGRPVLASWILVTALSVLVTQRAWGSGGISAPVAVFYLVFIVMAGTLLGARGAAVTAAVCTLGAVLLAAGNVLGWIAPTLGAGAALNAFLFVLLAIGIALVLHALVTLRPRREGLDADAVYLVVGDLRSPMQVLVSHLEALRRELRGECAMDAEAALEGARELRRMTNRLLDVTRLEAGRMPVHRSATDLSGVAKTVATNALIARPTSDITLEVRGNSTCDCDPDLTRRTLEHLVSNAIEVTPIDGRVRIVVVGSRDGVSVAISDEGPAVPPQYRGRMFEPFRADRPQRAAADESSGLALAYCRLAIEAQGGTIRIEDGVPCGNVFVVELPR